MLGITTQCHVCEGASGVGAGVMVRLHLASVCISAARVMLQVTELLRARKVCKEWRDRIDETSKLLLKPAIVREFGPWQVYMAGSWTSHNWKATYT